MDPGHSQEYLIDFYSVLGVERDVDEDTIQSAYFELQKQYHPDKYEHAPDHIKKSVETRSKLLSEIYAILSDAEKRRAYNAQLDAWEGSISENGIPVVDLSRPHFSPTTLLSSQEDSTDNKLQEYIDAQSGYDQNLFETIEALYNATVDPDAKLTAAYKKVLKQKDLYFAFKEALAWSRAGFKNRQIDERITGSHGDDIDEEVTRGRERIAEGVAQTLLMIRAGELKLLGSGSEEVRRDIIDDPDGATQKYLEIALQRFDDIAETIRHSANVRAETAEKRLTLVTAKYRPEQEVLFSKLLLCVVSGEKIVWLAFKLEDSNVEADESVDCDSLDDIISDPEKAAEWIEKGYNILFATFEFSLGIKMQVEKIAGDHFDAFLKRDEQG